MRIMFAAAVYAIWSERNARLHGESPRSESIIVHDVSLAICSQINSFSGVTPSPSNRWLHQSWGFSDVIFA